MAMAQPEGTPHFWPEGAPPPAGEAGPAPTELAGFAFGRRPNRVRAACTRAGHEWSETESALQADSTGYHCSGAARSVGFPVQADLVFCEDRLCEVRLTLDSGRVEDKVHWAPWALGYGVVVGALREAFGEEASGRVRADGDCRAGLERGTDAACFRDDARARHYWQSGGFEISVSLEASHRRHHRAPELTVRFQSPVRVLQLSRTSD